ncbi:ABC transporter substrate-binding protein [Paracraurococcus ruber]|uniref:ABC transporter substrate-binding protein n=1 Tax=Paracraurococcus ruber TaxID=77675 RepID=A0ABS1D068_9PROT|nr:ABC transporter substrate-binding protein [Paracraurococcus ruber]MBK1660043.1 ABC transporter substrate-binding protein [Paracraurococcus ruber]TDG30239.1 ABC transporter substrate-binding protein [Paracraurococcus ruber]
MPLNRRTMLQAGAGAALLPAFGAEAAESVLRVATTMADIPLTTGQPSQGGEGQRFIGYQVYDCLINWDLSKRDVSARHRPGLALSWEVDRETRRVWTFRLRPGVKFHDGSDFTAADVVWNLDKLMQREAPQYDQAQMVQAATYIAPIAEYRALDPMTVQITTKAPDAVFPYQVSSIFISSPRRWEEMGRDWNRVAQRPSGTGPWMLERVVPRQRADLVRNPNYWDKDRIPKSDRQVLLTVPDANTRVSALLSGQVDWIEAPPPDALPRLRQAGMQIVTNLYPHIWPYQLSTLPDAPTRDLRVRRALNLAVDREGLVTLLGGTAMPAQGMVNPGHPWFGNPPFKLRHDKAEARRLLAEAGYNARNPLRIKFGISTSGSGQMQPLPMNDFIQQNLAEVGVQLEFEVLEWEALRGRRRAGAFAPENKGLSGINNSWGFWDPDIGLIATSWSRLRPPQGFNWGAFEDPEADALASAAKLAFDREEQDRLLSKLHERIVDQAMWLWVVHDLNPRALGPKVRGFTQAQSWFQDLTPVHVG